jgi:hypothetical protein
VSLMTSFQTSDLPNCDRTNECSKVQEKFKVICFNCLLLKNEVITLISLLILPSNQQIMYFVTLLKYNTRPSSQFTICFNLNVIIIKESLDSYRLLILG